jgi:hypothetical protein
MTIGDKTWWSGKEVTITSEPYIWMDSEWIDTVDANGKRHSIATENQRNIAAKKKQEERREQQEGFARLAIHRDSQIAIK